MQFYYAGGEHPHLWINCVVLRKHLSTRQETCGQSGANCLKSHQPKRDTRFLDSSHLPNHLYNFFLKKYQSWVQQQILPRGQSHH